MAKVNVNSLLDGLQKALDAVQQIAPIAAQLGVVAPVATIAIAAASIARNILERVGESKEVLSSQNEAKIKAILEELQNVNDELNKAIVDS